MCPFWLWCILFLRGDLHGLVGFIDYPEVSVFTLARSGHNCLAPVQGRQPRTTGGGVVERQKI